MARRGFFAELQHQSKVAARERARDLREAQRARAGAIREAERTRRAEERARDQWSRATAADKKRLAREARDAHVAAMEAEVLEKNLELAQVYDELDSLLAATLAVDDFVDLNTLRTVVEHPPFDRTDLEVPIPTPDPIADPLRPVVPPLPPPPKGLQGLFGKKKYGQALAEAVAAHERAVARWQAELPKAEAARKAAATQHAQAEARRLSDLAAARDRYAAECSAREAEAEDRNRALDALIANLGYGTVDAVQEYVSIVLSNSVYPKHLSIEHSFAFDVATAELRLRVLVPGPDKAPTIGTYKYSKASDEVTTTALSQKACKDRYANVVYQVALRSMHEVFEADRRGLVKSISLEVGTETIDPATGREIYIPFVAAGAERDSFLALDLSNVVPSATLSHLGAAVSKNPFGLLAADVSGIRRA